MDGSAMGESINFDYNWDNLSVGNLMANQSGNFFGQNHPEHEKIRKTRSRTKALQSAENTPKKTVIKEERVEIAQSNQNNVKLESADENIAEVLEKLEIEPLHSIQPQNRDEKVNRAMNAVKSTVANEKKEFNVVRFAKVYDLKKKAIMENIERKEREQRLFHSKKAPNFQAIHAAVERKRQQHSPKITCPTTPSVLKRHRETQERLQKRKEEYEASLRPKPFVALSPDALRVKPFVPQLEKLHITPMPFNLQSEARLKERRQYDENIRVEIERKQQEKDEENKREEERIRRELRKATTFKALPNPFK